MTQNQLLKEVAACNVQGREIYVYIQQQKGRSSIQNLHHPPKLPSKTQYSVKSLDGNVNVWINYANERSSSLRENGLEPAGSREKYKQPQTKARHLGENKINTNTNINTEKILFRHGAW